MEENYKPNKASSPKVISNLMVKAINAKNPKTRYAAGKMAKIGMFARLYFGDKAFDKTLLSQLKKFGA